MRNQRQRQRQRVDSQTYENTENLYNYQNQPTSRRQKSSNQAAQAFSAYEKSLNLSNNDRRMLTEYRNRLTAPENASNLKLKNSTKKDEYDLNWGWDTKFENENLEQFLNRMDFERQFFNDHVRQVNGYNLSTDVPVELDVQNEIFRHAGRGLRTPDIRKEVSEVDRETQFAEIMNQPSFAKKCFEKSQKKNLRKSIYDTRDTTGRERGASFDLVSKLGLFENRNEARLRTIEKQLTSLKRKVENSPSGTNCVNNSHFEGRRLEYGEGYLQGRELEGLPGGRHHRRSSPHVDGFDGVEDYQLTSKTSTEYIPTTGRGYLRGRPGVSDRSINRYSRSPDREGARNGGEMRDLGSPSRQTTAQKYSLQNRKSVQFQLDHKVERRGRGLDGTRNMVFANSHNRSGQKEENFDYHQISKNRQNPSSLHNARGVVASLKLKIETMEDHETALNEWCQKIEKENMNLTKQIELKDQEIEGISLKYTTLQRQNEDYSKKMSLLTQRLNKYEVKSKIGLLGSSEHPLGHESGAGDGSSAQDSIQQFYLTPEENQYHTLSEIEKNIDFHVKEEIIKLQTKNARLMQDISKLNFELGKINQKEEDYHIQISELNRQLERQKNMFERQLKEVRRGVSTKGSAQITEKSSISQEAEKTILGLRRELSHLSDELRVKNEQLEQISGDQSIYLEKMKKQSEEYNKKIKVLSDRIIDLSKENSELKVKSQVLEESALSLSQERVGGGEGRGDFEKINSEFQRLKVEYAQLRESNERLGDELEEKEAELGGLVRERGLIEEKCRKAEEENRTLREQNKRHQMSLRERENDELRKMTASPPTLSLAAREDQREEVDEAEEARKASEDLINRMKRQYEEELKNLKILLESKENDIGRHVAQIEELHAKLEHQSQALTSKDTKIEELMNLVEITKNGVNQEKDQELESIKQRFLQNIEAVKSEANQQIQQAANQARIEEKQNYDKILKLQVESLKERLEDKISNLELENKQLIDQMNQNQVIGGQKENQVKSQLKKLTEIVQQKDSELQNHQKQSENYIKELSDKVEVLEVENGRLKAKLSEDTQAHQEEVRELGERINELSAAQQAAQSQKSGREKIGDEMMSISEMAEYEISERLYTLREENERLRAAQKTEKLKFEEKLKDFVKKIDILNNQSEEWQILTKESDDQKRFDTMKKRLMSKIREMSSLRQEVKTLKTQVKALEEDKQSLATDLNMKRDSMTFLAEELNLREIEVKEKDKYKKAVEYVIEKNKALKKRYHKLEADYKAMIEVSKNQKETSSGGGRTGGELTRQLDYELKKVSRENSQLSRKMVELRQVINSLDEKVYFYKSKLKEAGIDA